MENGTFQNFPLIRRKHFQDADQGCIFQRKGGFSSDADCDHPRRKSSITIGAIQNSHQEDRRIFEFLYQERIPYPSCTAICKIMGSLISPDCLHNNAGIPAAEMDLLLFYYFVAFMFSRMDPERIRIGVAIRQ